MPEPQTNSRTLTDEDQQSIQYAKQSLARGEPENKITAQIIQTHYPNDPAQGYDYARYILAEARFALSQERPVIKEQSTTKMTIALIIPSNTEVIGPMPSALCKKVMRPRKSSKTSQPFAKTSPTLKSMLKPL